jgi:hypothetical protein
MDHLPAVVFVALMCAPWISQARAESITTCTGSGTCYCVNADFLAVIQDRVATIRERLTHERSAGKATGYISIPISTLEGSYIKVNLDVAADVKQRVEARFGTASLWMLNPSEKELALPDHASGADYMLMWTRVLEGATGGGQDFDLVYFTGPNDFKLALKLGEADLMGQLNAEYERRAATDPGIKSVDKRLFRDYYALRASVAFSLGSHDEWNIVRSINDTRRHADARGIARLWAVWFDGQPVSPSQFETPAAAGYTGSCAVK